MQLPTFDKEPPVFRKVRPTAVPAALAMTFVLDAAVAAPLPIRLVAKAAIAALVK
jgi:hypothetical protein